MQHEDFFKNYAKFVDTITSAESKDLTSFVRRIGELEQAGCNVARLMTAGIGLASEGGEFDEIVKKMVFQGKEYDEETIFHMKRELGDVIWYWMQACMVLGFTPSEIIEENVRKLEKRYPGGKFDIYRSENREEGDL